jgi:hypothetical protein
LPNESLLCAYGIASFVAGSPVGRPVGCHIRLQLPIPDIRCQQMIVGKGSRDFRELCAFAFLNRVARELVIGFQRSMQVCAAKNEVQGQSQQ